MNILFFGNSFTMGSGGVPQLVRRIAECAGLPAPCVQMTAAGGKTLEWHIHNSMGTIAQPTDFVAPPGFQWRVVVFQEFSTRPTNRTPQGNPGRFLDDVVALYRGVRAHSPDVVPILFETWARSPDHAYIPDLFPSPEAMQQQLRRNYEEAQRRLNREMPEPRARLARVGDAWEALSWRGLYADDEYHANDRGSLLAAMVLFSTIFRLPVSGLDLASVLDVLLLGADDGRELARAADAVAVV